MSKSNHTTTPSDKQTATISDRRGRGWFHIDNLLLDQHGKAIGPNGVAVYAALCRYANSDDQCFPSISTVAKLLGVSTNTVRKTLDLLATRGLITIAPRKDIYGQYTSHLYTILPTGGTSNSEVPQSLNSNKTHTQSASQNASQNDPIPSSHGYTDRVLIASALAAKHDQRKGNQKKKSHQDRPSTERRSGPGPVNTINDR